MKTFAFLISLFAVPAFAQNPCDGRPDETAAIQAAVNLASPVNFEPRLYCVNARLGIRIPSERTLRLNGATIGIFGGCTQHCKAFETVPGSQNVSLVGPGEIVGDLTPAVGFSIGFRGDSVTGLEIVGVTFRQWRMDGIWLGGNSGTHDARIYGVTVEEFGRNGLSIVNGSDFVIEKYAGRRSNPNPLVGAAIDVEPNPPADKVTGVVIMDSLAEDVVVGWYIHAGRSPLQTEDVLVTNTTVRNASRYGIILNSTARALLTRNRIYATTVPGQPLPVGISVGATGPITADNVTLQWNHVEGTTRSAILAGVRDTMVLANAWVGGSLAVIQPSPTVPATAGIQVYMP